MHSKSPFIKSIILAGFAFLSTAIMANSFVHADDSVVDQINITVPVSCTMSGTGMNTHNAEINNGQYNSAIGETTLKAFCNDNEGFAIYAIGYTDNEEGKNVLTSSTLGSAHDIATGTASSGDTSNWAMKLSTVASPTPTYPITIQNSFDSFQEIPADYTLVAKRTSSTDIGSNAEGSTLKSTYQSYISPTQPASTYTGQVKYTLIHPHDNDNPVKRNQIAVVYNGNGSTFANDSSTNKVVYGASRNYIGDTPTVVKTSNLNEDGTKNRAYTDHEYVLQTVTLPNARKIKAVIDYGTTGETAETTIAEGVWAGWNDGEPGGYFGEIYSNDDREGQKAFTFNGDTVTVFIESWSAPSPDYDYGIHVKLYPIYTSEYEGTSELPYDYTSNTPTIVKTSNLNNDGTKDGPYSDGESILQNLSFPNAYKIKVVVDYSITGNTTEMIAVDGEWDGNWDNWDSAWDRLGWIDGGDNASGSKTYILDGDTATIYGESWGTPESDYDYGFYVRVYPIYADRQPNTSMMIDGLMATSGAYAETVDWNSDSWYAAINDEKIWFATETDVISFLEKNKDVFLGSTIYLYKDNRLYMQDIAEWMDNLSIGDEVSAVDRRDHKEYRVAKLADGKIWMVQNLDHDIKTDGSVIYNNTTTDLGWNTTTDSYDEATWAPIHSAYTHDSTSEYQWGYYGDEFKELYPEDYPEHYDSSYPESYNPGDYYWTGELNDDASSNNSQDYVSSSGDPHYHLGNYYNYSAATAMNYYNDYSFTEVAIEQSICPAGWTLPKASYDQSIGNDYLTLIQSYDDSFDGFSEITKVNLLGAPTYFALGGNSHDDSGNNLLSGVGYEANYLSSVNWMDGDYVFNVNSLGIANSGLLIFSAQNAIRFGDHAFIRCVAR